MPPPNTTATTALVISSFPYSTTQNAHDAGTTYDLWFKHTCSENKVILFGVNVTTSVTTYAPTLNLWTPTFSTLVLNQGVSGNPIQFRPVVGQTYWFQAVANSTTVTPAVCTAQANQFTNIGHATGDLLISADNEEETTAILRPNQAANPGEITTAPVMEFVEDFATGGFADILDSGIIAHDNQGAAVPTDINIYSTTLTLITSTTAPGTGSIRAVRAHRPSGKFYVTKASVSGTSAISALHTTGTTSTTLVIPAIGPRVVGAAAADPADAILYYVYNHSTVGEVRRWDIALNTGMSNLTSTVSSYDPIGLIVLGDNTIVVTYRAFSTTNRGLIRRYDTTGTTLNSVFFDFAGELATATNDPTSFWYMFFSTVTDARHYVNITSTTFSTVQSIGTTFGDRAGSSPYFEFGSPETCPLVVLRSSSPTGTIVVGKFVDPMNTTENFQFSATSPLSPSTFDLMMDEEQYFTNLSPGTYAITEVAGANPNWSPIYLFSNTSSGKNAIIVAAGENVTVAVLNQGHSQYSGLYKIVPAKRSDTYFDTTGTTGTTVLTTTVGFAADAQGPIIQDLE